MPGVARRDDSSEQPDEAGLFAGSDASAPDAETSPDARTRGGPHDASSAAPPARRAADGGRPDGEPSWPHVERRSTTDRRNAPTGWLSHPFGRGRRKAGRRAGERDNIYVDVYSRGDVLILLCIFLLNIGDAVFTLLWLQRGGGEGNPVMQAMLDIGVGAFLFQKCIIVGIWLLILTAHRNYRAARLGLWSTLSVYTLLIVYHLVLVGFDVEPVVYESTSVISEVAPQQHGDGRLDTDGPLAHGDGT
jgi:hypothetical protein